MDNLNITPVDWTTPDSIIKVIGVGGGGCNASKGLKVVRS